MLQIPNSPTWKNALKINSSHVPSASSPWTPSKAEEVAELLHMDKSHQPRKMSLDLDGNLGKPRDEDKTAFLCHYLQWCARNKDLHRGRCAHSFIVIRSFDATPGLSVPLVRLYGNCESMDDASKVFFEDRKKDLSIWNAFMEVVCRQSAHEKMLEGYARMRQECIVPDRSTFMLILSSSCDRLTIADCKQIHVFIIEIGCKEDVVVGTSLVNMYGRSGSFEEARTAFQTMPTRNLVTWTTMISLCARHSRGQDAVSVFNSMLKEGIEPDEVTFVNLLVACSSQSMAVSRCQQVHGLVIRHGFEEDVKVVNALINLYGRCGNVENSRKVFDSAQTRDVITWSSLITVYAELGDHVEVRGLFDTMLKDGQSPNKVTFTSILAMFDSNEALPVGRYIHNCIILEGLDRDVMMSNSILNMYNKCGTVEEAKQTFDSMMDRDVISWTSMIGIHAEEGHVNEALEAFLCMQMEGITPNKVTFINMLEACANQAAFIEGKCMHECIICTRFELCISIETALLKMYGVCGSFRDARDVFDRMDDRDVLAWNTVIALHLNSGQENSALQLFRLMQGQGVLPNESTYGFLLVACTGVISLSDGLEMHARIQGSGEAGPNVVTNTNLVNMYSKCGHVGKARSLFDNMPVKNVFSWTAMISAYGDSGDSNAASHLSAQMLQESVLPNEVTWISLIMASNDQVVGKRIHACMLHDGYDARVALSNAVINMYSRWGDIEHAQQTFDGMWEKNVVSWSGMISLYVQDSQGKVAMQLFEQMQEKGISPTDITLVSLLSVCVNQTYLTEGRRLHMFVLESKLASSPVLGNSVINVYGKCGDIVGAWDVFKSMAEKDKTTWNTMIGVCAEHGQGQEALNLTDRMIAEDAKPDSETFLNLLSACSHSGQVIHGWGCFASLNEPYYYANPDHCACVIDLFGRAGLLKEAEILMHRFPAQPTIMWFMSMLSACRCQGDSSRGEWAAKHILELDMKSTAPLYMLRSIYSMADGNMDHVVIAL